MYPHAYYHDVLTIITCIFLFFCLLLLWMYIYRSSPSPSLTKEPGFYRVITRKDISILNQKVPGDSLDAGYNVGDLLNMPALSGVWEQTPHKDEITLYRMHLIACFYKNSVLDRYCRSRNHSDPQEIIPNVDRIRTSLSEYITENQHKFKAALDIAQKPTTLCVHLRNGDIDSEYAYIELIKKLSSQYDTILLLSGIHRDSHYKDLTTKQENFISTLNDILSSSPNIYLYMAEPDIHLSIMMHASNLLLHKMGFSCLGSIVSKGKLFITPLFHFQSCPKWQAVLVDKQYTMLSLD